MSDENHVSEDDELIDNMPKEILMYEVPCDNCDNEDMDIIEHHYQRKNKKYETRKLSCWMCGQYHFIDIDGLWCTKFARSKYDLDKYKSLIIKALNWMNEISA